MASFGVLTLPPAVHSRDVIWKRSESELSLGAKEVWMQGPLALARGCDRHQRDPISGEKGTRWIDRWMEIPQTQFEHSKSTQIG